MPILCFQMLSLNATNHSVTTVGNTFSPANITVNIGDTVTWSNGGGSHNVNATLATYPNNPEGFGNSVSNSSWTLQHIFTLAGTYNYQCDPHTSMGMVGTVIVTNTISDVTFKVDMSQYSGSQGSGYTVNLNGTFNGWCGSCNPMTDADNDSVCNNNSTYHSHTCVWITLIIICSSQCKNML